MYFCLMSLREIEEIIQNFKIIKETMKVPVDTKSKHQVLL